MNDSKDTAQHSAAVDAVHIALAVVHGMDYLVVQRPRHVVARAPGLFIAYPENRQHTVRLQGMGKPLMIREEDERRIEALKRRLGIRTKVGVLRAGIELLEKDAERRERVKRWKRAAALAAATSRAVNAEVHARSRPKR